MTHLKRKSQIGGFKLFQHATGQRRVKVSFHLKPWKSPLHDNRSQYLFCYFRDENLLLSTRSVLSIAFPYKVLKYICAVFQELRSEIELEVLGDTEELQMSFTAICPNGSVLPDQKRCSNIKPGETVSCFALSFSFCAFL